jgi:two-component system, NarL family, nitrate/nitrite response regulator NarL
MTVATDGEDVSQVLRIALVAVDPIRHTGLTEILRSRGHAIVELDDADVILVDGTEVPEAEPPVVSLGGREAGQAGLLPTSANSLQIDAALRAAAAGLSVRAKGSGAGGFQAIDDAETTLLTPREIEVLTALGDGLSNKAVARRLGISQHTVKFHVESLFRKLDAVSRTEAVRKGLRQRLLDL